MTACTENQEYRIAFLVGDGDWEVAETFAAVNDDAANEYAEENYSENAKDRELLISPWLFVLNAAGKNINGGDYGGE